MIPVSTSLLRTPITYMFSDRPFVLPTRTFAPIYFTLNLPRLEPETGIQSDVRSSVVVTLTRPSCFGSFTSAIIASSLNGSA